VFKGNPAYYYLKDSNGEEIKGTLYEQEMQKTKHPDVFLVEKVLRKKVSRSMSNGSDLIAHIIVGSIRIMSSIFYLHIMFLFKRTSSGMTRR
jgi:hypothetical protein